MAKKPIMSKIWHGREKFFKKLELQVQKQKGPYCVAYALSIATGFEVKKFLDFEGFTNRDPVTWSDALKKIANMKLAYCTTDLRKVKYYSVDLLECDDLFIIGYYSPRYKYKDETDVLLEPGKDGSELALGHAVILYKDKIYDSRNAIVKKLKEHECMECHTKRIFRFVPAGYEKGI